jgi:tRNA pseudouridine38-40 synthase
MRIALGVSYDGSPFEGWQSQPSRNTVQDVLERALGGIAGEAVRVSAAGRTDTGVHALAQVVHFDTAVARPDGAWVRGTNAALPDAVAVQWACRVDEAFHARFSATARSYVYLLYNHPVRPAVFAGRTGWFHDPLDVDAMRTAAQHLLGEHDFSAFRSSECQAKSPVKTLERIAVNCNGPYVTFELTASAFLHHMVRNIVGCLVYVGKGRHQPPWLAEVLAARERARAAPTFPPHGLYLSGVRYDARWQLPGFSTMIPLLP